LLGTLLCALALSAPGCSAAATCDGWVEASCRRFATCLDRADSWVSECVDQIRAELGRCQHRVSQEPCFEADAAQFSACAERVSGQSCSELCRDDWSVTNYQACRSCCGFECEQEEEKELCLNIPY
jgi:hypothetical protein